MKRLDELFAAEPDRLSRLTFEAAGLYFDWSKTHLDAGLLAEFTERADRAGLGGSVYDSGGSRHPRRDAAWQCSHRGEPVP